MIRAMILPALLFWIAIPSFGSGPETPEKFCDADVHCTEAMRSMSREYAKGGLGFTESPQIAFSGACYHVSANDDPNQKQYGAFGFKKSGSDFLVNGAFFYFYAEDPYQRLSSAEILNALEKNGGKPTPTSREAEQLSLRFSSAEGSVTYWFRSTQDQKHLIVIGREVGADYFKYTYCKMDQRPY